MNIFGSRSLFEQGELLYSQHGYSICAPTYCKKGHLVSAIAMVLAHEFFKCSMCACYFSRLSNTIPRNLWSLTKSIWLSLIVRAGSFHNHFLSNYIVFLTIDLNLWSQHIFLELVVVFFLWMEYLTISYIWRSLLHIVSTYILSVGAL